MDARRKIGHELCVSSPRACSIIPHPVRQERQVERLRASGTEIVSFAPIVAKRTPYCTRKVDITWQVEPNDEPQLWAIADQDGPNSCPSITHVLRAAASTIF